MIEKKFSLRLDKRIYNELLRRSEYLGITLASILKYHLYELKNRPDLTHFELEKSVRMTLSLPIDFFNDLELKATTHELSINHFINTVLYNYLNTDKYKFL